MNTAQSVRLMRQRLAKNSALADIGRAENQPVDIRVVGGTVEELEAEIDRLHAEVAGLNQYANEQGKQIDSLKAQNENQAATVARLESEAKEFVTSLKDGLSAYKLVLRGDIYLTDRQIAALAFAQIGKDSS